MTNTRKEKLKKNLFFALKVIIPSTIIILVQYIFKFSLFKMFFGYTAALALFGFVDIMCLLFNKQKNPTYLTKHEIFFIICLIISTVYFFTSPCFQNTIGFQDIKMSGNGTYSYYVYAENEKGKSYTLTAEIHPEKIPIDEDKEIQAYSTQKVYFSKNQYLYFYDEILFDRFGDYQEATDQNGVEWTITLTDKHSNKGYFEEKLDILSFQYVVWIDITFFSILIVLVNLKRNSSYEDEEE